MKSSIHTPSISAVAPIEVKKLFKNVLRGALVCSASLLVACGGGSSGGSEDGSSDITFFGTLSDERETGGNARVRANVNICALGNCGTTDESGSWGFSIAGDSFSGGAVAFTLNASDIDTTVLVDEVDPQARSVAIDFLVSASDAAQVMQMSQDGVLTQITPAVDDGGLSGLSQTEQACNLIENSRIQVTEFIARVSSDNSDELCPERIKNVIVVTNQGSHTFAYDVSVDLGDITVSPDDAVLAPGESAAHQGTYRCTSETSFDTRINASISEFRGLGISPLSRLSALSRCNRNTSERGLSDSVPIEVVIEAQD